MPLGTSRFLLRKLIWEADSSLLLLPRDPGVWLYLPGPWQDAGMLPALTIPSPLEVHAQSLSLHLHQHQVEGSHL